MAYKFNPVTGKFEQQTVAPGPSNAKTPSSKIAPSKVASKVSGGGNVGPPSPYLPSKGTGTGTGIGSATTGRYVPPPTGQAAIDAALGALYDEAQAYKAGNYGEDPPAGWWEAKMYPIKQAQDRLDAAAKAAADKAAKAASASAAAAAKAEAEKKAELERQRKIRGGREAEAFLRQQADEQKAQMLKRVAELYDPLQTKTEADLTRTLETASRAYDAAQAQVEAAGADFTKGFTPSKAYSQIPLTAYTAAESPLLAALQQQGAQTGDVTAQTAEANQYMAQQSALEKWAAEQLNVGQQNYDTAVQQAAKGGLASALQGLSQRRADVKTGIEQQFADTLSKIAQDRTGALSDVDSKIQDIINEANKTRAETTANYGNLPVEVAAAKKKKGAAAAAGLAASLQGMGR